MNDGRHKSSIKAQGVPAMYGKPCGNEKLWRRLVSGALSEEETDHCLNHAAGCPECANDLRDAAALFADEASSEEEAFLAELQTATPRGRELLADHLVRQMKREESAKVKGFWSFALRPQFSIPAAAVIAVSVCSYIYFFTGRHEERRLLARAYDDHRLSELRIPGGEPVPLTSVTRSDSSSLPASMLRVELMAREQVERSPRDPSAHQWLGRVAVIEHDGDAAIRELEFAQSFQPTLPQISFDLGTAYFVRAEKTRNPEDYARATEYFSQQIASTKPDALTLYNRGLCWQRLAVAERAEEDYRQALSLEKDPAWRVEIARHLDAVSGHSSGLRNGPARSLESSQLSLKDSTGTPDDYELATNYAVQHWLPRLWSDPALRREAEQLEVRGKAHSDLWWKELLALPLTPQRVASLDALSLAASANARGDVTAALAESEAGLRGSAAAHYRDDPVSLRLGVEHLHAQQRSAHASECLKEARYLASKLEGKSYAQLQLTVSLEASSCHEMSGHSVEALREAEEARTHAEKVRLEDTELRAASFVVVDYTLDSRPRRALETGIETLQSVRATGLRRSQLLTDMATIAQEMDLPWTRQGLAESAEGAARSTGNLRVEAYALESLAESEVRVRDERAESHFRQADNAARQLGDPKLAASYEADWASARAQVAKTDEGPTEVERMYRQEVSLEAWQMVEPRIAFYTAFAEVLQRQSRSEEALRMAWAGVRMSEEVLASLRGTQKRKGWMEAHRGIYETLVACLAQRQDNAGALRAWTQFQDTPYRGPGDRLTEDSLKPAAAPVRNTNELLITYARIGKHYIAWAKRGTDSPRMKWISADADSIDRLSDVFTMLCSNPHLSLAELNTAGSALSRQLLLPFTNDLLESTVVYLNVDDALAGLPFVALPGVWGETLGLAKPLIYLRPSIEKGVTSRVRVDARKIRDGLLLLHSADRQGAEHIAEQDDETAVVSARYPRAVTRVASLEIVSGNAGFTGQQDLRTLLAQAVGLHYSGHGTSISSDLPRDDHLAPLTEGTLPRCALAVLAACKTSGKRAKDVDDVSTLAGDVMDAGATTVISAQWDIDSRTTRQLMTRFYSALDDSGDPARALQRAQEKISTDPSTAHPFYWAAFQVLQRSGI